MNDKNYSKEEIEAFLTEIKPIILDIVDLKEETIGNAHATMLAGVITRHFYEALTGRTIEEEINNTFSGLAAKFQEELAKEKAANE